MVCGLRSCPQLLTQLLAKGIKQHGLGKQISLQHIVAFFDQHVTLLFIFEKGEHMRNIYLLVVVSIIVMGQLSWAGRAPIETRSKDPYVSALVMDADTGTVLFEENRDARIYPASVLKLMVLLIILERVEQNVLALDDMVQVTAEAARMGGSQVYLDPKEQFSVDDLLYALMVQSANDAAVALAIHVSGSKNGFVALMNKRAAELGMSNTRFYSVHGLPPAEGQKPDQSTAADLAKLSRALATKSEAFRYTGTTERDFRDGTFIMRTHNHLLKSVEGCDGFKTGYFKAAGFSIVATAQRANVRIIAIVLGSIDRKVRDAKAAELLARGFNMVPPRSEPVVPVQKAASASVQEQEDKPAEEKDSGERGKKNSGSLLTISNALIFGFGFGCGLFFCALLSLFRSSGRSRRHRRFS